MADASVIEKRCCRCKEVKPVSGFYTSKDVSDGYASQCKACIALAHQERKGKPKAVKLAPANIQVFYNGPVIEREPARQLGLDKYFTNRPCVAGHIAERYIKGGCVICKAAQGEKWRQENPDRYKQWQQQWYQDNKEKHDAYSSAWSKANKSRRNMHSAKWRSKNRERVRDAKRLWRQNNPYGVAHHRLDDPDTRRKALRRMVNARMKCRMRDVLIGGGLSKGGKSWLDFVSYSVEDLIKRLKKTMPVGYTWDDFVSGSLHLDHIVPVSAFNFTSPTDIDFQRCWDLKNLQLLPAAENLSKSNKLAKPFQPSFSGI